MLAEHRRSPRSIPGLQVGLILLLDRSRPRGCRIRDYSQHGVLLKCTTHGSPLEDATLDVGDAVTVRFWDRNEPGRSGVVRGKIARIMQNEVAIEYSDSESAANDQLLSLLTNRGGEDSTEAASPEKSSPLEISNSKDDEISVTAKPHESLGRESRGDIDYGSGQKDWRSSILIGGIALVVLVVGLYGVNLNNRIDEVTQQVASLQTQQSRQDQSAAVSGLTERMMRLEDSQRQITAALSETAGQAELQAAIHEIELELGELKIRHAELAAAKPVTVESPKQTLKGAEWVIHLVTLKDPNAADKLIAKATTLGFDIHKSKVTVHDEQMYRLSIKGVSSRQEAEKLATTVQQQLALTQKPWIARQ